MRRILSLMLVVASSWMIYKAADQVSGVNPAALYASLQLAANDINFLVPFIAGLLGLAGGMTVFLGGGGGASIAFCGGLIASGFFMSSSSQLSFVDGHIWQNEFAVGITMLGIAALACLIRSDA